MIIDAHSKVGKIYKDDFYSYEELIKEMDENNIDMSLITCFPQNINNDYVYEAFSSYPNRLLGLYTINPWLDDAGEQVNQAIQKGFRGIALDPIAHGYSIGNLEVLKDILDVCEENKYVIWINTFSESFTAPVMIGGLAEKYPNVTFIMGHMGFNYDSSMACKVAGEYEKCYIETSGAMAINFKRALSVCGSKKVLMATGRPDINFFPLELATIKEEFSSSEDYENVTCKNISKILNLGGQQ